MTKEQKNRYYLAIEEGDWQVKDSPCSCCEKEKCSPKGCAEWKKWFRERWRKVQKSYAEQKRGSDRERDTE